MKRKAYEHAVHTWMFADMPLAEIMQCLDSIGFSADLSIFESGPSSPERIAEALEKGELDGVNIPVTTSMFNRAGLDLSASDEKIRSDAVAFGKKCIDITKRIGADRMLVSPSPVITGAGFFKNREEDLVCAAKSMTELGEYAAVRGIKLMIEPINRYRVSLIHTVGEALELARLSGCANVGVVADVFHMEMEEKAGIVSAIKEAGDRLFCLHIGGKTRVVPGRDETEWAEIMQALGDNSYDGILSYEPVYLYFDAKSVETDKEYRKAFLSELLYGKKYLEAMYSAE